LNNIHFIFGVLSHIHQIKGSELPQNKDFAQVAQFYRFGAVYFC